MQYVQTASKNSETCIFCAKPQAADDEKNLVLFRDKTCFALMNLFPYNAGHLLVAPYKHTSDLDDLTETELTDLMLLTRRCRQLLAAVLGPEGYNVGLNLGRTAGAGIEDHLHFHIVPRWNGDTNFMPVLGETRVIPDALESMYRRLKAGIVPPA
jgi:ATP adenylyltransferase